MKNSIINNFLEDINNNSDLKDQLRSACSKKKNLYDFLSEDVILFAEKLGYHITLKDCLDYQSDGNLGFVKLRKEIFFSPIKRLITVISSICFFMISISVGLSFLMNQNKHEENIQNLDTKEKSNEQDSENGDNAEEEPHEVVGALDFSSKKCGYDAREIAEKLKKYDYSPQIRVPGDSPKKVVFLTFDDGPSLTVTPKILEILGKNDVKATFFVVGEEIQQKGRDAILKRTLNEGHALANHTFAHDFSFLYPKGWLNINNFLLDLEKVDIALKNTLGDKFQSRVVRAPGGTDSWKGMDALEEYISKQNMALIDWNVVAGDAETSRKSASQLLSRVISSSRDMSLVVLLLHDSTYKTETVKALQEIIDYYRKENFEFGILV
ncbi:MAG: polysaccharide deacetylase [Oscillospiraceae bacterium]|jgi:peptidoglycan/xylan/chitin deacetylase (PgdA/CDA1 family)|nr:polysaccharide deacetylase [Oscillospiraceae bacterium]